MYVQAHPGSRQHLIHAPFHRLSPPPLPLSTRQLHLLLQTVHPHPVTEEQYLLLCVATTGLLAVIPISLHCVFRPLVGLAYWSDLIPPVVMLYIGK